MVLDKTQESFAKDMAHICYLEADIAYMQHPSTVNYAEMLVSRSRLTHSPAYASGSVHHNYLRYNAKKHDRLCAMTAMALTLILEKCSQRLKCDSCSQ